MKKLVLILATLFLSSMLLKAQPPSYEVEFEVVDQLDSAIVGAHLIVSGTGVGTVTNIDGKATLICPIYSSVIVTMVGYLPEIQYINGLDYYKIILKEEKYLPDI